MVLGFFGLSVSGLPVSGFRVWACQRICGICHGQTSGLQRKCLQSNISNQTGRNKSASIVCSLPAGWSCKPLGASIHHSDLQVGKSGGIHAAKADEPPHFQAPSAATLIRQSGKLCTWWLHGVTDWHSSTGLSLWYSKTSPTRPANCLGRPRLSDVLTCQTSSFVLCFRFSQQDPANAKTRAPKHRLQPSGIGNVMSQRKGGVRSKL
jgi:hypothetical protein